MGGLTVLPCPRLPRPPHAVGPDRRQIVLKSGNLLLNWATNYAIVSGTGLSGLIEVTPLGVVVHTWVSAIIPPEAAAQKLFIPTGAILLDVEDLNHDVQARWRAMGGGAEGGRGGRRAGMTRRQRSRDTLL